MKTEIRKKKIENRGQTDKGFTLVELLIVCGMLGIVMGAIFTLYQTHQRSAYTQEEVVEVQQNLRIAMDSIARDLRMAGFMVPDGTNPLSVPTVNSLTINTASEGGKYARISEDNFTVSVTAGTDIIFTVDSNDAFSVDSPNRQVVRIIRPANSTEPVVTTYTVEGVRNTDANCSPKVAPCLVLNPTEGGGASVTFSKGDIIAKIGTTASESYPNTIAYSVTSIDECPSGQNCIQRDPGTAAIVANNIQAGGLEFSYILDNGSEPAPATLTAADLPNIRAVRVTITGETVATTALSGGQAKTRQIASILRIRNR